MGAVLGLALFCVPNTTIAASTCSYSEQAELNEIAANVKTSYEVVDVFVGTSTNPDSYNQGNVDVYVKGLKVNILNISKDINVKVVNNTTGETYSYSYENSNNGIVTFDHLDVDSIHTYTIEVYSNKYSCIGELVRKIDFVTPKYNFYSGLEICNTYPDFYYCQEFLTTDSEITYDEFLDKIEKLREKDEKDEKKEKNKTILEKVKEFYDNNKVAILIAGGIIVVGGVTATVMVVKKKRSRVL